MKCFGATDLVYLVPAHRWLCCHHTEYLCCRPHQNSSLNYYVQVNFTSLGEATEKLEKRVVTFLSHFQSTLHRVRSWCNQTTQWNLS